MLALLIDPADFGSPVEQGQVLSALAHSRIPYVRMPGSLLDEAYSTSEPGSRKRISISGMGKRYLQQGRQSWQSMD